MNITGKQLVELGIITKAGENCIAQHGCDLELIKVESFKYSSTGEIPKEGKTKLVEYEEVGLITKGNDQFWYLKPGTYAVTFSQGCNIPADKMLLIRQRSSLLRNGTILHSSVFDAGFKTDRIGTVIVVTHEIFIEYGARIAQIYAHNSENVENLYDGQFQGDKQRQN